MTAMLTTAQATRDARKVLGKAGLADVKVTSRVTTIYNGRLAGCIWTDVHASYADADKNERRLDALKTLDHVEATLWSDDHLVLIRKAYVPAPSPTGDPFYFAGN